VEFTKPLEDQTVKEKETLTLTCELNKPDKKVKWLKNGKEIKPDKRIKFSVDQYQRQLIMTDVTLTDSDKYTCVCGDVSTECTIKVEGKFVATKYRDKISYFTSKRLIATLQRVLQ
jgi:hypothetical protein